MLFNSYEYIFLFLPGVICGYFLLCFYASHLLAKVWLVLSSLFFYSWWNIYYLPLLLMSLFVNYFIGQKVSRQSQLSIANKKKYLFGGVSFNVGLLLYFKYSDFMIEIINLSMDTSYNYLYVVLPLAISFFTFQQIGFLVDTFKGHTKDRGLINYALFVTFFPQLIAGPIVHHRNVVPQFMAEENARIVSDNVVRGTLIFCIGLFKKVVLADAFAVWASAGHAAPDALGLIEAWGTSLSYILQLYFDFSGYSDMAIGIALTFNIKISLNFNSPFKAANIRDLWHRWHMTLRDFVTRYIYGSLGGGKKGRLRNYINLFVCFFIIGVWHGAGWTFVIFGVLHGVAVVFHKIWQDLGGKMPKWLGVLLTFNFFQMSCVLFRAKSVSDAVAVYRGMFGLNGLYNNESAYFQGEDFIGIWHFIFQNISGGFLTPFIIMVGLIIVFFCPNTTEISKSVSANSKAAIYSGLLFGVSILMLSSPTEFLYFNF